MEADKMTDKPREIDKTVNIIVKLTLLTVLQIGRHKIVKLTLPTILTNRPA